MLTTQLIQKTPMKTLKTIREAVKKERTVFKRKYDGFRLEIIQRFDKFEAYVDDEKLDTYQSVQEKACSEIGFVEEK